MRITSTASQFAIRTRRPMTRADWRQVLRQVPPKPGNVATVDTVRHLGRHVTTVTVHSF